MAGRDHLLHCTALYTSDTVPELQLHTTPKDDRIASFSISLFVCCTRSTPTTKSLAALCAIFFNPNFRRSSSRPMKQQEQQSSIPDTNHRLRNKETAIFLVSPDDFIHMSIKEGPEEGANKGYNIDSKTNSSG